MWPKEDIPDEAVLYFRIHKWAYHGGVLNPSVFVDQEGGMSVDWAKYSDAVACRSRARNPGDNGVVSFNCGEVRQVPPLTVEHEPIQTGPEMNRAHSEVLGEKDEEVQVKLSRISRWEIYPPLT